MRSKQIIAILFFFIPLLSFSQENTVMELTLDKAISLALDRNRDIKVAELEVEKSHKKVKESFGNLLPSFDASGQYTRNIKKPVIFLPPGTPFGPPGGGPTVMEIGYDNSYNGTISASLPIFMKQIYSGLKLSKQNLKLSKESYRESKINTISNVKKAYYGVLLTRELRDFMRMSLKDAEDNLENVRKMHKQGLVADYDLLKAEVQIENLKPNVMQAEDNYKLAIDGLKIAIGLNSDVEIKVLGQLKYDENAQIPTLDEALTELLAHNTTLRKLYFQTELTKTSIELAKAEFYPSLVAFGNYQYQTQADDFKFSDYYWVKTAMVGLQLQIPLFHGLSRVAKVQQAELSHRQVIEQQSAVTEAIKTQLHSVLYQMAQAKKRIEVQKKSIEQAQLGYRIAQSRYKNGLGTQLEVNDAEVALTQARFNYAKAVYDFLVATVDYEQLVGKSK
ncbi:MAG TPA: TolC family protein [Caldithrix abyssi]|uniref:TolC family protein n=1 Tax=Caldithrix abyssi TaxID=187145 RepID=A0A7V5LJ42_CALAY|nr:TolC family protein [Caldithrix abyssi]